MFVADGYSVHDLPQESYVEGPKGNIVARVQEKGYGEITITGDFWIEEHHVLISDRKLVSGGITMSGNIISGSRKAISIEPDSCSIGSC